jgi:hypothetical protein
MQPPSAGSPTSTQLNPTLADVLTMPVPPLPRVCSFYLKQKMWWVGIVVFTIGNIMVSTLPTARCHPFVRDA